MSIVIPEDTTEYGTENGTPYLTDRAMLENILDIQTNNFEMLKEIHTVMMYLGKTVKQINDSPGGIMKLLMGGLGRK